MPIVLAYDRGVPRRVGDFRGLTQPSRVRLLRAIQREPGRRANELADECEIPLNTARDHLRVLEVEGLIRGETRRAGGRGRPPLVFHPVREAASNSAAGERVAAARRRGSLLRAALGTAQAEVDSAVAQLDVIYEHLDDVGLEPVIDEDALTFELTPCRFHDLIDVDQSLVCSMHAGLVRDVLRQVDGPLALRRLDPFVTAHQCRLVLERRDVPVVPGEQRASFMPEIGATDQGSPSVQGPSAESVTELRRTETQPSSSQMSLVRPDEPVMVKVPWASTS